IPDEVRQVAILKHSLNLMDKVLSSYLRPYPELVNPYTGKIHPVYKETGTVTGRISCEKPNFQQIPRQGLLICKECNVVIKGVCPLCGGTNSKEIANVNDALAVPPGFVLVNADYSQMEVRVLAHVTGDPELKRALQEGLDLHSYTASKIFNLDYNYVVENKDNPKVKTLRQQAKAVTFGIIYGITPQGLAATLKCAPYEAEYMIKEFFNTYRVVKQWIDRVHKTVEEHHWIATPIGRVRHFDVVTPKQLREAQNYVIQSFASDIAVHAAKLVSDYLKETGYGSLIGFVHDSIKTQVKKEVIEQVIDMKKHIMEHRMREIYQISVPLVAEVNVVETYAVDPNTDRKVQEEDITPVLLDSLLLF
ncbi:MAG: DNA polymerase A family protein, partial [Dictyoglomus turgidum]